MAFNNDNKKQQQASNNKNLITLSLADEDPDIQNNNEDHNVDDDDDDDNDEEEEKEDMPISIRVLVCSGNIGNAKPNLESIQAWIPLNGFCKHVLRDNPQYPIVLTAPSPDPSQQTTVGGEATTLNNIQPLPSSAAAVLSPSSPPTSPSSSPPSKAPSLDVFLVEQQQKQQQQQQQGPQPSLPTKGEKHDLESSLSSFPSFGPRSVATTRTGATATTDSTTTSATTITTTKNVLVGDEEEEDAKKDKEKDPSIQTTQTQRRRRREDRRLRKITSGGSSIPSTEISSSLDVGKADCDNLQQLDVQQIMATSDQPPLAGAVEDKAVLEARRKQEHQQLLQRLEATNFITNNSNDGNDSDEESIQMIPLKDGEDTTSTNHQDLRQFDIIVIGMQEATFDVEREGGGGSRFMSNRSGHSGHSESGRFMSNRSGHSSHSYNFDGENSLANASFAIGGGGGGAISDDDVSFFGNDSVGSFDGDGSVASGVSDIVGASIKNAINRPPVASIVARATTPPPRPVRMNASASMGELPPRRPPGMPSRKKSGDLAAVRLASEPSLSVSYTTTATPSPLPSTRNDMSQQSQEQLPQLSSATATTAQSAATLLPEESSPERKSKKSNAFNMAIMRMAEEKANKRKSSLVHSTTTTAGDGDAANLPTPSPPQNLPRLDSSSLPPVNIQLSSLSMHSTLSDDGDDDNDSEDNNDDNNGINNNGKDTTKNQQPGLRSKLPSAFSFRSRSQTRERSSRSPQRNDGGGVGDANDDDSNKNKDKQSKLASTFSFRKNIRNRSASPAPRKNALGVTILGHEKEGNVNQVVIGSDPIEQQVGEPLKRTNSFSFKSRIRHRSASPAARKKEPSLDDSVGLSTELLENDSAGDPAETAKPELHRKGSFLRRMRSRSPSPAPRKDKAASSSSRSMALPPSRSAEKEKNVHVAPKSSSFNLIPRIRARSTSPVPRGQSSRATTAPDVAWGVTTTTSGDEIESGSFHRPPLASNKSSTDKTTLSFNTLSRALLVPTKLGYKAGKTAGSYVGKGAKLTGKATISGAMVTGRATMAGAKSAMKASKAAKILTTDKDHTRLAKGFNPHSSLSQLVDGGGSSMSDTAVLHELFEDHLPGYRRALSYQRGEMRLIIYCLNSDVQVDVLSVKAQATGRAGLANKGGIVAEVAVNKTTRLAFATAHLEAHEGQGKYATRCSTIADILRGTESSAASYRCDASLASHFTFFMGDLNFRTRLEGLEPGSMEHIAATHELVGSISYIEEQMRKSGNDRQSLTEKGTMDKEKEEIGAASMHSVDFDLGDNVAPPPPPPSCYVRLNEADELAHALTVKDCLVGFSTPYCNFPPTFKVARGPGYRYNGKRSPSYTDRILYKTADQLDAALTPLLYEPVEDFTTSDHKPIRGAFDIQLNEKLQWRPVWKMMGKETELSKPSRLPFFGVSKAPPPRSNRQRPNLLVVKQMGSRECMHLFISSITCQLMPNSYNKKGTKLHSSGETPSPFVCFVTTPSETVQKDNTSWDSMLKKIGINRGLKTTTARVNTADDEEVVDGKSVVLRTMMGWPRTKKLPNTFRPEWGEGDEVHFKVRTHNLDDGEPIDLSGAMLHIVVYDGKGTNVEPRLLGSFTLNLANMIVSSKTTTANHDAEMASGALTMTKRQGDGPSSALKGVIGKNIFPAPVLQAAKASLRQHNQAKPNPSIMLPKVSEFTERQSLSESSEMNSSNSEDGDKGLDQGLNAEFRRSTTTLMSGPSDNLREAMLTSTVFASKAQKEVKAAFRRSVSIESTANMRRSMTNLFSAGDEGEVPDETQSEELSEASGALRRQPPLTMFGGRRNLLGDEFDQMNIVSLRLDEPLMKNGKEVGRISCGIDAWWMEDDDELTGKK